MPIDLSLMISSLNAHVARKIRQNRTHFENLDKRRFDGRRTKKKTIFRERF